MGGRVGAPPSLMAAWLGRVEYPVAWELQRGLFEARCEGRMGDLLLLLEHPHTYTLGRRALEEDLVYDAGERTARGIGLYRVDRGGRATYHGPGQLVGYPIMWLGEEGRYDVLAYLRSLEEALTRTVAALGVEARRDARHTGVWVGSDKIAAIGVKISRGVTMHGFALNVTTDLSMFGGIVPCGIQGRWVTSVAQQTGMRHRSEEVATMAAEHVAAVFDRPLVWTHADRLFEAVRGESPATLEAERVRG